MTVTVYLRANQNAALSWNQVDSNFSSLATAVNANTAAIASLTSGAGGPTTGRPASPLLYQSYFDTTLGFTVWCSQLTPSIVWVNAFGVSS